MKKTFKFNYGIFLLLSLLINLSTYCQVIPITFFGGASTNNSVTFLLPKDSLKGLPGQKLIIQGYVELTNQKDNGFNEFSNKAKVIIDFDTIEFKPNAVLLTNSDLILNSKKLLKGNVNVISGRGLNGNSAITSLDFIGKSKNGSAGNKKNKNGQNGKDGKIGKSGKRGGNGYRSSSITLYLTKLDSNANLNIKTDGGNGGNGGDGNNGGEGGDGGSGMDGSKDIGINGGNGGNSGSGGKGGNGGFGGDGGDAGLIQIIATNESYYILSTKEGLIKYSSKGGVGGNFGNEGKGGMPGSPGIGGKGISIKDSTGKIIKGKNGIKGKIGKNGSPGVPGKNGRNGKSCDLKLILQTEKRNTNGK